MAYKVLKDQAPSYLKDLIVSFHSNRAYLSKTAGSFAVIRLSKSRMGGRDCSYQAHLLWNQLPVWVHDTDTLSTFHIRLQSSSLFYAAIDCEEPFMMH